MELQHIVLGQNGRGYFEMYLKRLMEYRKEQCQVSGRNLCRVRPQASATLEGFVPIAKKE